MIELSLRVLAGTADEVAELQCVLEAAPRYAELHAGAPPGPAEAQSVFGMLPEGKSCADKLVFGIYSAHAMVGCIDLIRAFPDDSTSHIGLLLIAETSQGRGVGSAAYARLEQLVRSWPGIDRLRLGVLESNIRALSFWSKQGFAPTGESKPHGCGAVRSRIIIHAKTLVHGAA